MYKSNCHAKQYFSKVSRNYQLMHLEVAKVLPHIDDSNDNSDDCAEAVKHPFLYLKNLNLLYKVLKLKSVAFPQSQQGQPPWQKPIHLELRNVLGEVENTGLGDDENPLEEVCLNAQEFMCIPNIPLT